MNMKKLWKRFDDLSRRCYMNMIGANESFEVWDETFSVLMDIISSGRDDHPDYAKELADLEESLDYARDISGWLEDYLDELDMYGHFEKLERVCDKLLKLFCWNAEEGNSSSDLKFRMSSVLSAQGKKREALEFSERWYDEEPDNLVAAVSLINARVGMKDLEGAESLVKQYISDAPLCNDENEILFSAAAMVYKLSGNKKEEKRMNKAIKEYEKVLEDFFMGKGNFEDDDLDFDDEELPF